jgi:chromosome segregation ATPase
LPSFAEAKRTAAELRRRSARLSGSSNDELLALAEDEIEQLKKDLRAQKQESGELLQVAESEREQALEEAQRLRSTLHHLQHRVASLENSIGEPTANDLPSDLEWHWRSGQRKIWQVLSSCTIVHFEAPKTASTKMFR